MKAIKSTVFIALFFTSTAVLAQADNTQSKKQERYFRKFSVQFGPSNLRFVGKKEPEVEHSKEGYGGHILPAWNITDNHSLGLKMVWSYHNEKNSPDNFSLLANYQFTYFGGPKYMPEKVSNAIGLYAGLGIGFSNTTDSERFCIRNSFKNVICHDALPGYSLRALVRRRSFSFGCG